MKGLVSPQLGNVGTSVTVSNLLFRLYVKPFFQDYFGLWWMASFRVAGLVPQAFGKALLPLSLLQPHQPTR